MKYVGNIYYGTSQNPYGGYFKGNTYASDIVPNSANTYFKQCDFIYIEGFSGGTLTSYTSVNGNISSNPNFVSGSDLHLQSSSPCIDKVDAILLAFNHNKPELPNFGYTTNRSYQTLVTQ